MLFAFLLMLSMLMKILAQFVATPAALVFTRDVFVEMASKFAMMLAMLVAILSEFVMTDSAFV